MFSLYKNSVFLVCTGLHDQSESRGATINIKKSNSVPNINPNANVHVILNECFYTGGLYRPKLPRLSPNRQGTQLLNPDSWSVPSRSHLSVTQPLASIPLSFMSGAVGNVGSTWLN